jgi:hypothetical protein
MKMCRYEIEPRPAALGGAWPLHLIGNDPETGAEIEMGGGVFPIESNVGEKEAFADGLETGQLWLAGQSDES